MARPSSSDIPPTGPLSPFQTPPTGAPAPVTGSSFSYHGQPSVIPAAAKAGPTPLSLLNALKRRWILATFIGGLVATAVGVAIWLAMPAGKHQARALIMIRPNSPDLIRRSGDDFESFRRSQAILLRTRDLINRTLAEPKVASLDTIKGAADPIRFLEDGIRVESPVPDILSVYLTGDNADDLQVILDQLTKKYIDDATLYERKGRDDRIKKLARTAETFKAEIAAREHQIRRMAEASATSGLDDASARNAKLTEFATRVENEVFQTDKEIEELKVQIAFLEKKLKQEKIEISTFELNQLVDMDPEVFPLIKQRTEKQFAMERATAGGATADAPTVVELKAAIAQLDKDVKEKQKSVLPKVQEQVKVSVRQLLEARIIEMKEQVARTEQLLVFRKKLRDDLHARMAATARTGFDITQLMKELDPTREYLHKVESQLIELRVEKEMDPRVSIREPAHVILNQNLKQKTLFSVAGGLAAFIAILTLVGFLEWRTRRIDGVDQVVTELGMRVIGTVPAFPNRASLKAAETAGNANWRFVLNESINSTRTMLLHTARHQSMQVVMITSATQGEGKTSLASQLGSSMATAGMRTLIVDCDLRNPSIHKLFDLELMVGVSEVLCQEADVADAIQPTSVPNLWVIPAGQCSNE